jgi:hypothetical protein
MKTDNKAEKLFEAIGLLNDDIVINARNAAPCVTERRFRPVSMQFAGVAASVLIFIAGTLFMFYALAPVETSRNCAAPMMLEFNESGGKNEIITAITELQSAVRSKESIGHLFELDFGYVSNAMRAEDVGILELTEFYYPNITVDGYWLNRVAINKGGFDFMYTSSNDWYGENLHITIINPKVKGLPYAVVPADSSIEELIEVYGAVYSNIAVSDGLILINDSGSVEVIGLLENTRFYVRGFREHFDIEELQGIAVQIIENAELVKLAGGTDEAVVYTTATAIATNPIVSGTTGTNGTPGSSYPTTSPPTTTTARIVTGTPGSSYPTTSPPTTTTARVVTGTPGSSYPTTPPSTTSPPMSTTPPTTTTTKQEEPATMSFEYRVTQIRSLINDEEVTVISTLEQFIEFRQRRICNCPCEQLFNLGALQRIYDEKFFENKYIAVVKATRSSGWEFSVATVQSSGLIRIVQKAAPTLDIKVYHIVIELDKSFQPDSFTISMSQ